MPTYYERHKEELKAYSRKYSAEHKTERAALQRAWAAKNPEAAKAIKRRTEAKHAEAKKARARRWYLANAERIKAERMERYHNDHAHREKVLADGKTEVAKMRNRERAKRPETRIKTNRRRVERAKTDENFRLRAVIGSRISNLLTQRRALKAASTMTLIGCDIHFLREYLQARFAAGMSWENYGLWHVDHRVPCASFDLREPDQQRQCFHYSNLRPMWGVENISKGSKMPGTHQSELV